MNTDTAIKVWRVEVFALLGTRSADFGRRLGNVYKVLLTRGMIGTVL